MSTNKKTPWKENKIFSVKLRNGHFSLLQMLKAKGEVIVFNIFKEKDDWDGVELTKEKVLFSCCLLDSVLKRSEIQVHKKINPYAGFKGLDKKIDITGGFREVTLWKNTKNEISFGMMGGGNNKIRELARENGEIKEKYTEIDIDEYQKYKNLELTNLCDYPSFNERLYLCEIFKSNIDPLKELAFDRSLDVRLHTYISIISGKIKLSELGY